MALGASAGGLHALEEFFSSMPAQSGMAFVVVTHQAVGRTSLLPELLARSAHVPVVEAVAGMQVEPDRVYVAPPGSRLRIHRGQLEMIREVGTGSPPLPIDTFLRSLAEDRKHSAFCIILSGTGTDGTLGLQAIKGESGLVVAQDPITAEFPGMPTSAIATGLVDFVLPVGEMPERLIAYARGPFLRAEPPTSPAPAERTTLKQILALLNARTGGDFSGYKVNTLRRRVERRMALHQLHRMEDYLAWAQKDPGELQALFKELLIGVTSFFRDPNAWKALAAQLQPLLAARSGGSTVRAWILGCATGEEAYSVAMLLIEGLEECEKDLTLQVFATDLDAEAIEVARAGRYPAGIAVDVSAERLQRFFARDGDYYVVNKEVRARIVFAAHDLLKNPPFTRIDLISCRNLLIYLDAPTQERVLPMLHHSLNPDGLLFLGTSESIGSFDSLFSTADREWKLFRRRPMSTTEYQVPGIKTAAPEPVATGKTAIRVDPSELMRRLLTNGYAPPSVLVNSHGQILQIHGRTGDFLEPAPGKASLNLTAMVREDLRSTVVSALHQAARHDGETVYREARTQRQGKAALVRVAARKVLEAGPLRGTLLVSFENPTTPLPRAKAVRRIAATPVRGRAAQLQAELARTREELQHTIEELQTANEELTSVNEEMQSVNEEMQSTNEELETSREEMQSLNEELQTVNAELQSKIAALTQANDDLQNLLNSTQIPTVFLDREFRVRRFTPDIEKVFHLIPTDVGRPISDISTNLEYRDLMRDAGQVLETLVPKDRAVRGTDGSWYSVRIAPYRTGLNAVDGIVVAFVDVTRVKLAEAGLNEARDYAKSIVDTMRESLVVLDADLRVLSANPAFYRTFRLEPEEVANRSIYEIGDGRWDVPQLRHLLEASAPENEEFADVEMECREGKKRRMLMGARKLERNEGRPGLTLLVMEDTTERRDLEGQLRAMAHAATLVESRERRRLAEDLHDGLGQFLALARLKLGMLRSDPAHPGLEGRVREIEDLIGEADEQATSMTLELSPPALENSSLEAAVQWIAADVGRRFELRVEVEDDGAPKPLDEGTRVTLYRSVRELLVNVAKHAGTREARVRISRKGELVHMFVEDRGAGFDPREVTRGFGLFSTRERLRHIAGSLEIESMPGDGTEAHITVPISERQSVEDGG